MISSLESEDKETKKIVWGSFRKTLGGASIACMILSTPKLSDWYIALGFFEEDGATLSTSV